VIRTPEVYDIPLRALYSRNIANLMMAGRNISASHAAFTSTRVMATCACIGQAAGLAASFCCRDRVLPRQLAENRPLVGTLQQTLLRFDQSIRTVRNQDPADLARRATVTASAEKTKAALVIDGIDRGIPANRNTAAPAETHHWAAQMSGDGTWIQLAWDRPQNIREVILKFDTGFDRELTLTASDSFTRQMVRAPQPETVADYTIEVRGGEDDPWQTVAEVKGNHQRLNRITFRPVPAEALRIRVSKTNGIDEARIFELRCYG
jgi:hypothetical protein